MRLLSAFNASRVRVAFVLGASQLLAATLVGTGCQISPPAPQPGVTDVTIQNLTFSPREITVARGDSVRWTNNDLVLHTATSGNPGDADAGGSFDTGDLSLGESVTVQFNDTGEFVYFCRHHPAFMFGAKVTVTE